MLPLVHHVVSDVVGRIPRFVDRDDLHAAGLLGLAQAARSFDPDRGVSFSTYARVRIRGAVLDELRSRDAVSRGTRRMATRLTGAGTELEAVLGRRASAAEIAGHLGLEEVDVRQVQDDVARAASLERPAVTFGVADASDQVAAADADPVSQLLDRELRGYLVDAVCALPERLRRVVVAHYLDGREMQEIAAELGVTPSRVSQLCAEGVALLRDGINAQLDPELVPDLTVTTGRVGRRKSAYYATVASSSSCHQRLDGARRARVAAVPAA
jgi:RNA polymerase sigma factor for flagellar operon FliA